MIKRIPLANSLPFDIISLIMQFSEAPTLVACTLVSRLMREAARPWLFWTITLMNINSQVIMAILLSLDK